MFYKEDPPNFLLKGGQTIDLGRRSPWWGGRKEGTSDLQHSWSHFLVGFIHPVWWHPPDDGRLCPLINQVGNPFKQHLGGRSTCSHSSSSTRWATHSNNILEGGRPVLILLHLPGRSPSFSKIPGDLGVTKMEALVAIFWVRDGRK